MCCTLMRVGIYDGVCVKWHVQLHSAVRFEYNPARQWGLAQQLAWEGEIISTSSFSVHPLTGQACMHVD